MSRPTDRSFLKKLKANADRARRCESARKEFAALLDRHRVRVVIERGESSEIGVFTRIDFVPRVEPPTTPPAA